MTKRHSREEVRRQALRAKARALRHIATWSGRYHELPRDYFTPRGFGRFVRTPQSCSSWCCGHRRFWNGPTPQEQRHYTPPIEEVEEERWSDRWGDPELTSVGWWWFEYWDDSWIDAA